MTMALDQGLLDRRFAATPPYVVTHERVAAFAQATGGAYAPGDPVPATFPIVLAFAAMNAFLDEVGVELSRIVHGEQRFAYERPIVPGEELRATLSVASLRQIGGNDIIGTLSEVTDPDGAVVCTAKATLVHRGAPEGEQ